MIQFLIQIIAQHNCFISYQAKFLPERTPEADGLLQKRMGRYISNGSFGRIQCLKQWRQGGNGRRRVERGS